MPLRSVPRSDGQEGYSLVCGERRFRAARLAGWETIRAKICPMSDAEAEDFAIAENLQREDITPFEQGQAFQTPDRYAPVTTSERWPCISDERAISS